MKNEILKMLDKRDKLLAQYRKKNGEKSFYPTPKADEIEHQILGMLLKFFDNFECDFVLETLTRFGSAPSLIYDDNGHWAVSGCGTQPVVWGRKRLVGMIGMGFDFERKQWYSSIRPAVLHYLKVYAKDRKSY